MTSADPVGPVYRYGARWIPRQRNRTAETLPTINHHPPLLIPHSTTEKNLSEIVIMASISGLPYFHGYCFLPGPAAFPVPLGLFLLVRGKSNIDARGVAACNRMIYINDSWYASSW